MKIPGRSLLTFSTNDFVWDDKNYRFLSYISKLTGCDYTGDSIDLIRQVHSEFYRDTYGYGGFVLVSAQTNIPLKFKADSCAPKGNSNYSASGLSWVFSPVETTGFKTDHLRVHIFPDKRDFDEWCLK